MAGRQWLEEGEDFLLCNTDILYDLDLLELYNKHVQSGSLATLAVSDRLTSRYLLFDKDMRLSGWKNAKTEEVKIARPEASAMEPFAFSGIHVINPRIFSLIKERGKFSIIDLYLRLAQTEPIYAWNHTGAQWLDVGKPERLALAEGLLRQMDWSKALLKDSSRD